MRLPRIIHLIRLRLPSIDVVIIVLVCETCCKICLASLFMSLGWLGGILNCQSTVVCARIDYTRTCCLYLISIYQTDIRAYICAHVWLKHIHQATSLLLDISVSDSRLAHAHTLPARREARPQRAPPKQQKKKK